MEQPPPCPDCGLIAGPIEGPLHAYIGGSPGCWASFNDLMTIGAGPHVTGQLINDAYAVQHPGRPERRAIQSVCVHAINLCARFERRVPENRLQDLMRTALRHPDWWHVLELSRPIGGCTVGEVLAEPDLLARGLAVQSWSEDIWATYRPHHATTRNWVDNLLGPVVAEPGYSSGGGRRFRRPGQIIASIDGCMRGG